jgi:hypothetical protein
MKHTRYSHDGVRVARGWSDQILGAGLLVLALACYRLITQRTILQTGSMVATYLFGIGLILYPTINRRRLLKSIVISVLVIALAALLALTVIYTKNHTSITHPFTHKQVVN